MARKRVLSDTNGAVTKDDSILNDILVESLNKKLGDVAFILGKGDSPPETKEWLSTGSTILDTIISNDIDAEWWHSSRQVSRNQWGGSFWKVAAFLYDFKRLPR